MLAATGLTASFAGCAGVSDQFDDSEASDPEQATTAEQNGTATTNAESTGNGTTSGEPETTSGEEGTTSGPDVEINDPDVFSSAPPTPSNPSDYRFATMGAAGDAPTATVYGSWKCPYTQEFVLELLPAVVGEYVASGDLAIEFRAIAYRDGEPFLGPDGPRATRAGLAAWDVDPDAYWEYFAYVFANQPPEREAWAQPDVLRRFASEAGVESVDQFVDQFSGSKYEDATEATVSQFQETGASHVPRVATDDEVTAPTVDFDDTREQLRRLVENGN